MLKYAKNKLKKNNLKNITFIKGDAEKLPFEANSFDYITISYGFRNISDYNLALSEFFRVLKPGGKLGILEFSKPHKKIITKETFVGGINGIIFAIIIGLLSSYWFQDHLLGIVIAMAMIFG